jgi:hypothetical protein
MKIVEPEPQDVAHRRLAVPNQKTRQLHISDIANIRGIIGSGSLNA